MQPLRHVICGVILCALPVFNTAQSQDSTFAELKSGKKFPAQITFTRDGKEITLLATGAIQFSKEAKRGAGEASRYVMAHHMEAATPESLQTVYAMILERPVTKQMTLDFEREASAEDFKKMYARFFAKTLQPAEYEQLRSAIDEFMAAFSVDIKTNERLALRWLPDNRLVIVLPNATEKVLQPSAIASWIWKAWFSEASQLDRAGLVEKLPAR